MKAIIKLDVPDYQIGQEVHIYFKDTMTVKGICEEAEINQNDIADILNAINRALDDTEYEAVGFDNTGYFLKVLIDYKER